MTDGAKQLAGIGILLVAALGLWLLIGSDTAVSTFSDLVVKAFGAIIRSG